MPSETFARLVKNVIKKKGLNLAISKEDIARLLDSQELEPIGSIEFFETEDGLPLVRLGVGDDFTSLDPLEQIGFLLSASHVSMAAARQISTENPDLEDEIMDLIENLEIEPMVQKLNS